MATAAIDPATAIAAAHRELYEQLRELVNGGPSDDLLDRVRKLTKSVGQKITRARKLVEPGPPSATDKLARPAEPKLTAPSPAARKPPDRPRTVPASRPAPSATVRVPEKAAPKTTQPPRPAIRRDRPTSGRIRGATSNAAGLLRATPHWAYLLVVLLLGVLGVALSVTTGNPLPLGGAVVAVLGLAGLRAHRRGRERAR